MAEQQAIQYKGKPKDLWRYCVVVILGEVDVGKTNLLKMYQDGRVPKNSASTIGVDYGTKVVTLRNGQQVKA